MSSLGSRVIGQGSPFPPDRIVRAMMSLAGVAKHSKSVADVHNPGTTRDHIMERTARGLREHSGTDARQSGDHGPSGLLRQSTTMEV